MALLCVAMFVEWGYMGTDTPEFFRGFLFGFVDIDRSHTFDVLAIIGSVVMPHNLYLHSGEDGRASHGLPSTCII